MSNIRAFVNLTPHDIVIQNEVGTRSIPASGEVARCAITSSDAGEACGVPLSYSLYGAVKNLPEPAEGVLYIVSALVRSALPQRLDLASPGELVRDGLGNVVGCRNLVVNRG